MSSNRNKILSGLSTVPGGGRTTKTAAGSATGPSKEYLEAVHTLSDANMQQACQLLLSTMKYEANADEGNVDADNSTTALSQIKDMYFQAVDAAEIIQTQQPTTMQSINRKMPPGAPSLTTLSKGAVSSAATLRQASLKPKGDFKLPTGGIKHSVVGMKKGTVMRGRTGATSGMGMKMKRGNMPSINPGDRKKQRISPTPDHMSNRNVGKSNNTKMPNNDDDDDDDGNSTPTTTQTPPPSALSFLAKLNKSNEKNRETSVGSKQEDVEEEEMEEPDDEDDEDQQSDSSEEEADRSKNKSPTNSPTRRNPSRGFHPNRK